MNFMNYHRAMKKPNHSLIACRSVRPSATTVLAKKGSRRLLARGPQSQEGRAKIKGEAFREKKARISRKKQSRTVGTSAWSVLSSRSVATRGTHDYDLLTECLKTLGIVGDVTVVDRNGGIDRILTIRSRNRQRTKVKHTTPQGVLDAYERESTVRTVHEVRELAVKTVRMLGAEHMKEAVDYLTAIFKTVSTGAFSASDSDISPVAARSHNASTTDPLAAARARGRQFALEEYESPDNLALLDARDYVGRNDRTINEQRQRGELYALLPPGKTRGFRYPKWQFDAIPERLMRVLHPFVDAKANAWIIHSFMRRKRDEIDGKSPAEVILDEGLSIEPVVELALRDNAGEQGAA
jgi:hypothetical protein